MCCSSFSSPKKAAGLILRVSVGLSLIFLGITHYRSMDSSFLGLVTDGLGPIMQVGVAWAYIMPGLMILSGVLLTLGMFMTVAVWAGGIALGSIPAGMLLKSAMGTVDLGITMPAAVNAWVWLLVFFFAVKKCGCHKGMGMCGGACMDKGMCACGDKMGKCPMCGMNPCVCKKDMPMMSSQAPAPKAAMTPKKITPKAPKKASEKTEM